MSFRKGVPLAVTGEPTQRYFLPGQRSALARITCQQNRAVISRYFFYTNLTQYGCQPRYFTMVSGSSDLPFL